MRPRFLISALLVAAACSGPAQTAVEAPLDPADDALVDTSETFDIGPYADAPSPVHERIVHDVPTALLQNEADAGVLREVDGFRVQAFSTLDANEAAATEDAVKRFLAEGSGRDPQVAGASAPPAVYRLFRQPYYRIRVGDFVQRARAEQVARMLATAFPGSFVVPDRVMVRK